MKWLYLAVNLFSISVPLWQSFEPKVRFIQYWKAVSLAIISTAIPFIIWDIYFTEQGIWGFNPDYLIGIYIANLPLEEVLFFICIPYACVFTYEALNYYWKKIPSKKVTFIISYLLIGLSLVIALLNYDKWYTFSTFSLLALFIMAISYFSNWVTIAKFYKSYLVILIPFFIVNGVLTGTGIENEIVWYNDSHNLGLRMGTIPVEDTFYGMLLIGLNIYLYQMFKNFSRTKN